MSLKIAIKLLRLSCGCHGRREVLCLEFTPLISLIFFLQLACVLRIASNKDLQHLISQLTNPRPEIGEYCNAVIPSPKLGYSESFEASYLVDFMNGLLLRPICIGGGKLLNIHCDNITCYSVWKR